MDLTSRHYQADADLATFVAQLPKTETHLHLEGSVSFEQLNSFDPERYPEPPPFWAPQYRFDSFDHFQSMFNDWILPYHSSLERYRATAEQVFANCAAQGCRYVECSFHLPALSFLDCDGPELLSAIIGAAPKDLEVRIFGAMMHTGFAEHEQLLNTALTWDQLSGIDLHGPENWPVDEQIPDYWARARDHAKITKAHAGEFMPATFVDWVIDNMKAERIQHGTRSIESPTVVDKLVEHNIVLDMCPISNLKLGVDGVETLSAHPIKRLMDKGVCVTVSTDDTFLFGNSLVEEYYALTQELGFTRKDLIQLARNGFATSLLSEGLKAQYLKQLDHLENQI